MIECFFVMFSCGRASFGLLSVKRKRHDDSYLFIEVVMINHIKVIVLMIDRFSIKVFKVDHFLMKCQQLITLKVILSRMQTSQWPGSAPWTVWANISCWFYFTGLSFQIIHVGLKQCIGGTSNCVLWIFWHLLFL